MTTRVIVAGAAGRMGREIVSASLNDDAVAVVGGLVRPGSLGHRSFADVTGTTVEGARIGESIDELGVQADVLVDFSTPEASLVTAVAAADRGIRLVIGTTGHSAGAVDELRSIGSRVAILYSRNTSIGVNALLQHLPALARALAGYDIEITEAHHRHKKDAPSGTALAIAEVIASAIGVDLDGVATYGRQGIAPRGAGEIGIHAVRGGGNAGEHTVLFADEGEQIQIIHRAYSRRTFAIGALRAARFVASKPAGFYSMADMLRA